MCALKLWKTKVGTRRTFNRGAKLCSFVEFLDLHGQVDKDLGIKNRSLDDSVLLGSYSALLI